ncbi:MAG: EAL domain-containing protein [Candidatus Thiodiazotropha lotti]|nr:EAL domain-containing protein [Candidatus Thiodiazotropha lotti]MCG8000308.1 EAL domain-containing protein [Candidatus Thiodiazotropha lotti]MCW4184032.1 EAL domain-containing protein [Candidatus Thiodiazotropha weberae]MCW4192078.1 EAL domain-containing protein [Candidatus Thiodiazotropha weberae]
MHKRYGRLKIISKIWIFIVLFILIMSISLVVLQRTLHTTYELVKEVADTHLNDLTDNATKTRQLAVISSDINRLTRTYSTSYNTLAEEGKQISIYLSHITDDIDNQTLITQLKSYSNAFELFLNYSRNINNLKSELDNLFSSAQSEITLLENLISTGMIDSALNGADHDYYDQLLSLVTGYRESILIIDKMTTELLTPANSENVGNNDLYDELYSLYLRVQTITASMPEVSVHGRNLSLYIQQYKEHIKALITELIALNKSLHQLALSESSIHLLIAQTEEEASLAAEQIRHEIDVLFIDVLTRMGMLMLIMVIMIITIMYYMLRRHIEKPLNTLTGVVSEIGVDHLDKAIILGRDDEWKTIENALNEMSKKLAKSYSELEVSRTSYHALVNNVPGIVYRCRNDTNWTMEYLSDEFSGLTGYDISEVLGNRKISYSDLIHPLDRDKVEQKVNKAVEQRVPFTLEYRIIKKDGEVRWVYEQGRAIDFLSTTDLKLNGIILDVTQQKQLMDALGESETRYRLLLEHTTEGIFGFDENGITTFINQAASEMLGYRPDEIVGSNNHHLIHHSMMDGTAIPEEECCMMRPIKDGCEYHVEDEVLWKKGGTPFPVEYWSAPVWGDGKVIGSVVSFHDISERKRSEKNMQHLAYHDLMTGLPNRVMFNMELKQVLAQFRRRDELFAVHLLDLDHFKEVNDRLGHPMGDKLLKQVSLRLLQAIRETDMLSRLGGDEFALIQRNLESVSDASYLASKILDVVNEEFIIDDNTIYIDTSIGIFIPETKSIKQEDVLSKADLALYKAKEAGRGMFTFFGDEMSLQMHNELSLSHDLIVALKQNEFFLQYQPQFDAVSKDISGVEALVRWNHPKRGVLMPVDFIHIAEKRGMIKQISDWVLYEACKQAKLWSDREYHFGRIAINLCAKQVNDTMFQQSIENLLTISGLPANLLELEFTETVFMEATDDTKQSIRQLSKLGVHFAIDDFGTGFSSLSYLHRFKVDKLKIDKEFIHDVNQHRHDAEIAKAAIALGKSLELTVVAEGVETQEQVDFLLQHDCDLLQGFLYGQPVSAEEFETRYLGKLVGA